MEYDDKGKVKMYIAVDILKAFACLLIFNFHSVFVYPKSLQMLSFGGDLGNNIFFLVSGFSLAKSICKSDINDIGKWLYKRYTKILPICFVFSTISFFTYTNREFVGGLFHCFVFPSVYWFTTAIAVFYPLLFLYSKLISNEKCKIIVVGLLIIIHIAFDSIYAERYIIGFLAMISGLELKQLIDKNKLSIKSRFCIILTVISLVCYLILKLVYKLFFASIAIHLFIGLVTIFFAMTILCLLIEMESKINAILIDHKYINKLVKLLSSLTLYVYLCQQLINFTIVNIFNYFRIPISVLFYWIVVLTFSFMTQKLDTYVREVIKKCQKENRF